MGQKRIVETEEKDIALQSGKEHIFQRMLLHEKEVYKNFYVVGLISKVLSQV